MTTLRTLITAAIFFGLSIPAVANEHLQKALAASPQLNGSCSSSVIYSKRDEKSGEVKTVLLTAKHCVSGSEGADHYIEFPIYEKNRVVKKEKYIAQVLGTSYKSDLALMILKDKSTLFENVMKIAEDVDGLKIGDEVLVIGYPLGLNLTVTKGTFVGYETLNWPRSGTEFLRATPDIAPGNSGGLLLKINGDGSLEQIGVTAAGVVGFTFMNLFVGVDQIRDYLKVALPEALGEEKKETIVSPAGK